MLPSLTETWGRETKSCTFSRKWSMFYHFLFVVVGESTGGVCKVRDSRAVEINNTTLLYTSCLFNWEAKKHIFGFFLMCVSFLHCWQREKKKNCVWFLWNYDLIPSQKHSDTSELCLHFICICAEVLSTDMEGNYTIQIFKCYDSRCDAAIRTSSSVSMSVSAVTPDSAALCGRTVQYLEVCRVTLHT